ncbi:MULTISPECIES: AGE family epimerase/isomerase [unclassified Paenibacillus]|uniref:AGE family epimerase/isomerase n=1 Tax=unclassified Paenibacillus TaxID=185978 RepID=UPI00362E1F7D
MNKLLPFYQDHVQHVLLPFWMRALDDKHGGVYTCFNNIGNELIGTDKYTWSQGRFIWLLAKLSNLCSKGLLQGDADFYLQHARKTVDFLQQHVFMENGNCAYVLSESGEKKELAAGEGYDTSFYADCFVVLGFAQYAVTAHDSEVLKAALRLYHRIDERLADGDIRSEPYPIPDGYKAHSVSMIMLNVSQELADALEVFHHEEASEIRRKSSTYMDEIMECFLDSDGLIREMLPANPSDSDTLLSTHITPGHSLECMWFVMHEAGKLGRTELIPEAIQAVKRAVQLGWDSEFGGLFRYVDRKGEAPQGRKAGGRYEGLVCDTWDMKIWWPHSEALYVLLLAHKLTGDTECLEKYEQMHDYVFRTFPNSDPSIGEWVQIRNRRGDPVQKTVALPVKDPYHIMRNALLIIELLSDESVNK